MEAAHLTQKRSLTDLVMVEYQALFAKAFGYVPNENTLETFVGTDGNYFILTDGTLSLYLHTDGGMQAERRDHSDDTVTATKFFPYQVLYQLILFGIETTGKLTPKTPADRQREQEAIFAQSAVFPADEVGPRFHFRLLSSNLPRVDDDALNQLLMTAWHWTKGETLHQLPTLEDFQQKLHQELYYLEADKLNVKGIQLQWLDDHQTLTIASSAVPVTIYAMISLSE
ncbi:hypothetical protein [Spirosoma panaciterrae]|uniref:hypothetical protein n=1 Tax=Spirosoma panaciterrae TaxID=496058 RepID=UPI000366A16C|nr:hypothetical protein [Spirosoma panaciterrae]